MIFNPQWPRCYHAHRLTEQTKIKCDYVYFHRHLTLFCRYRHNRHLKENWRWKALRRCDIWFLLQVDEICIDSKDDSFNDGQHFLWNVGWPSFEYRPQCWLTTSHRPSPNFSLHYEKKELSVKTVAIINYHLYANGQVERFRATIVSRLR